MLPRIAASKKEGGTGVEVLLSIAYALPESSRNRLVKNFHPGTGANIDLYAEQTRMFIVTTRTN